MSYTRIFLVSLVVLGATLVPSSASAATISDLIAQATKLQAQIAQLKAQQVLGAYTANEDMQVMPLESEITNSKATVTAPLVLPAVTPTVVRPVGTTPLLPEEESSVSIALEDPKNKSSVKHGDDITVAWSTKGVPTGGAVVETLVKMKTAQKGYENKPGSISNTYLDAVPAGQSQDVRYVETSDLTPGVYNIMSRARACNAKGCAIAPGGKVLTAWTPSRLVTVVASTASSSASAVIEISDTSAEVSEDDHIGIFDIEFEVYADDGDIYVPLYTQYQDKKGISFSMVGDTWEGSYTAGVAVRGGDLDGDWVRVREGDSETFEFYMNLDPKVTGDYGVRMDSLQYALTKGGALTTYTLTASQKKAATTEEIFIVGDSNNDGIEVTGVHTDVEARYVDGTVYGEFEIAFDIAANDGNLYIPTNAARYSFPLAAKIEKDAVYVLTSTADRMGTNFVVREGDVERFTLNLHMQPAATGSYAARLDELMYRPSSSSATFRYTIPQQHLDDFTTDSLYMMVGSTTMKGAFDAETLTSQNESPTITGTAGVEDVIVVITLPGNKVYGSDLIRVQNGKWSHTVTSDLRTGTYPIALTHPRSGTTLATGTLSVTNRNEEFGKKMAIIVGVYEGFYPGGRKFRDTREGTVFVNLTGSSDDFAQPLVLTAYEPTNWIINNPNGAKLSKIVTVGYGNQRVTGAPAGTPVEHNSYAKNKTTHNAYEGKGKKFESLVKWVEKEVGGYSGVFYGSYTGSFFNVEHGWKG